MGLLRFDRPWQAILHPARRPRSLRYWRGVHERTLIRWGWYKASPVSMGRALASRAGWAGSEWAALYTLWDRESHWNPDALNPYTGACEIPQFVPCRDWDDTAQALKDGIAYIKARYGSPSAALAHSDDYGWY